MRTLMMFYYALDGERKSTPIGRGRGFRFGFENNEYYFKSQKEMKLLFLIFQMLLLIFLKLLLNVAVTDLHQRYYYLNLKFLKSLRIL